MSGPLLPQQLYWHAHAREFDKVQDYNLFDCIECGCCAQVCPSHIPLVQYYRFAKTEIWDQERERQSQISPASATSSGWIAWNAKKSPAKNAAPKPKKRSTNPKPVTPMPRRPKSPPHSNASRPRKPQGRGARNVDNLYCRTAGENCRDR